TEIYTLSLHDALPIFLAPDDQGRQPLGEVEAFVRAHALPAEVHHASNRLDERAPGRGLLERNEAAPCFGEIGPRADAQATHAPDEGAHAATSRGAEPGEDGFGPRERRGPEQRMHLAAEASAGDEDEALAALDELIRELHRDPAAERMPDDRRPPHSERF